MKIFLTPILFFLFLVSCQNNEKIASPNLDLVKEYYKYFNQHDFTKMAEMYIDTANFKDPSLGQGVIKQTRKQTIEKYTALSKTFPDLNDRIIKVYPSGNEHVIVEFVSTGTGPDGMKFELPICTIFTFENGKITEDFTYYDNFEEK
jgi:ketosteroid isomerase-like protein